MVTLRRPEGVAVLVGLLFGLAGMGTSAVAVTLPEVSLDLGVGTSATAWLLTGYGLSLAVSTAVFGRLADLFGIRVAMVSGILIMSVGVLVGSAATAYPVLLAARVLQGAGAASVVVLAVASVSVKYDGVVRARAMGIVVGVASALSALGPLLGGAVDLVLTWRGVVSIPALGLLLVPLLWRELPSEGSRARLDVRGALLVAATVAGLVLLVQSARTSVTALVVGVLLLAIGTPAVLAHIRWRPYGFLPHVVVSDAVVQRTAIAASAVPAAWFATLVAVPTLLTAEGWTPVQVGFGLVPAAIVGLLAPRGVEPALRRLGPGHSLALCACAAALALAVTAAGAAARLPWIVLAGTALLVGCFGLVQPALVAAVTAAVPPTVQGSALGVVTMVFLVGGGLGSAVVGGTYEQLGAARSLLAVAVLPVLAFFVAVRGGPRPARRPPAVER